LTPTVGAEIQKTRPAIIVSDDSLGKLPLKIIVPITDWKERYEIATWMIKVEPNSKNGPFRAQVCMVSGTRGDAVGFK
jgi:mRNA interferase MazF